MIRVKHKKQLFALPKTPIGSFSDRKYEAKIVATKEEFESVLRLRRDVFRRELANNKAADLYSDLDEYDARCVHLLVTEKENDKPIGTYRVNAYDGSVEGFYASNEFFLEALPIDILEQSVELGRACIAREHRNTRVLFLLWRVLAAYTDISKARYLFGCCSVFTQDPETAADVLEKLRKDGHVDESLKILPRPGVAILPEDYNPDPTGAEIPPLVNIYMRIGAKVCGEPAIDRELKTVDYFVVFDLEEINKKYHKMFFGS